MNDAYSNMEADMHNLMGELAEEADLQKMERMKNRRFCIVETCYDCPHFERIVELTLLFSGEKEKRENYCNQLDVDIKNPYTIPTDCPLPKYKETAAV